MMIIYRNIKKDQYQLKEYYLRKLAGTQLRLKKYKCVFICVAIIIVQFLLLIKLSVNYNDLYALANSAHPHTFWYVHDGISKISVRRTSNVSLVNDSVIVTACGRNVADALPVFRKNLYSILNVFRDHHILLGESDSTDNTLMSFRRWEKEDHRVHVYTYGSLTTTYSTNRAHRVAFCRNNLLRTARQNNWLTKAKFLLVMDIDINANSILTVDKFLTNFEYDMRDWAVMTASQTEAYYDIWAVKSHTLNYDCWEVVGSFKHQEIAQKIYIGVHTKPIPREMGLISVRSAFGGFGVYQTLYLNNCHYEAFDKTTREKCEHISFHDCIISNGGKIFINPKFQNADGHK